jgi:hypothetical protein
MTFRKNRLDRARRSYFRLFHPWIFTGLADTNGWVIANARIFAGKRISSRGDVLCRRARSSALSARVSRFLPS